jgi:hypothetical protein
MKVVKKYDKGGKNKKRAAVKTAAQIAREKKLAAIKENNRLQAQERAVRQRQGFGQRLQGDDYDGGAPGGFTLQEVETLERMKKNGKTKSLKK